MFLRFFVVQALLYIVVSSLQAILLGLMTLRKSYREFPFFYAYTACEVFRGVGGYWLLYLYYVGRASYMPYFLWYWVTEFVALTLSFIVVYRLFDGVFAPYANLRTWGRTLYLVGMLALVALAVATAASAPGRETVKVVAAGLVLERSVALVRCGLLLLIFAAATFLGLSWKNHLFGIALGFGLWSTVDLANWAVRGHIGPAANYALQFVNIVGYSIAVGIWFLYFVSPQRRSATAERLPDVPLTEWNRTLDEYVRR